MEGADPLAVLFAIFLLYAMYRVWSNPAGGERKSISAATRQAVWKRDRGYCRYCGRKVQEPQIDHIIPVVQGGDNAMDNLVTSCQYCNRRKGGHTPEEAKMDVIDLDDLPGRKRKGGWLF